MSNQFGEKALHYHSRHPSAATVSIYCASEFALLSWLTRLVPHSTPHLSNSRSLASFTESGRELSCRGGEFNLFAGRVARVPDPFSSDLAPSSVSLGLVERLSLS